MVLYIVDIKKQVKRTHSCGVLYVTGYNANLAPTHTLTETTH